MAEEQLREAIGVGEKIASGDLDLVELDRSLMSRGKMDGKYGSWWVWEKEHSHTKRPRSS